jgi:hypothetical protein
LNVNAPQFAPFSALAPWRPDLVPSAGYASR